jgi:hypothetical protein
MRKPVLIIFANACLLIAIFGLLAQSLFVVERVATVKAVEGKVEVQRGGEGSYSPLVAGMVIQIGDMVRTAAGSSAQFSWLDGTRWKLLHDSEAAIRAASFSSTHKTEVSKLQLLKGKVLVRVAKALAGDSSFEVETPTALAATRGQVFSVAVRGGFTAVDVFKGTVSVSNLQGDSEAVATPEKRAFETVKGWHISRPENVREFLAETDFVRPLLQVDGISKQAYFAVIKGQTEAGSRLVIDGKKVPVLGNGTFVGRVQLTPYKNSWKIVSTDSYGQTNSVVANAAATPSCEVADQDQRG